MHHSFFDRYSDGDSVIHRLDARTKILSFLICIFAVVLTPPEDAARLACYGIVLAVVFFMSYTPVVHLGKRLLAAVPFILCLSLSAFHFNHYSPAWLGGVLAKALIAVAATVLLSATTRFPDLLIGLRRLRVPSLFILLLSFMYRYVYLIFDEAMRMERARQARSAGGAGKLRSFSHLLGALFVRTYERGERIYAGMLSRGFDGELRAVQASRLVAADALFAGLFVAVVITIRVWR